ncbi:MAG: DUF58 domain-containing protein [Candidatus Acidiferrales bacterium]
MASFVARLWQERDRSGWRNFAVALLLLAVALLLALYSAAAAETYHMVAAAVSASLALALSAWVGVTIVPRLARRTNLRWFAYQVDYRLTREGLIYLGAVGVLILAAVNTGNNLLFLVLACLLAGILISGIVSRIVLAEIELKLEMPEHVFAEQPVLATVEIANNKNLWHSFSLRVVGEKGKAAEILPHPVYFPFIPRRNSARQKVELCFPRRGVYRQDAFGIRTKFPFGFLEKTRRVNSKIELVVYPRVEPAEQFYEILPLLSGEMESYFRGRGHDLYSIRNYESTDSARFVDWKATAKTGTLKVREFAREDERRVLLVLDPFMGPPRAELGKLAAEEHAQRFERAVSLTASIAWHFYEIDAVMQFRTDRFVTPMASASEIIYLLLRELAFLQFNSASAGGVFLDSLAEETEVFKIILTRRPQASIPTSIWASSYVIFIDSL